MAQPVCPDGAVPAAPGGSVDARARIRQQVRVIEGGVGHLAPGGVHTRAAELDAGQLHLRPAAPGGGQQVALPGSDVEQPLGCPAGVEQLEGQRAPEALGRVVLRRRGVVTPVGVPVVERRRCRRSGRSQLVTGCEGVRRNIWTVSSEKASSCLPSPASLFTRSLVIVMT